MPLGNNCRRLVIAPGERGQAPCVPAVYHRARRSEPWRYPNRLQLPRAIPATPPRGEIVHAQPIHGAPCSCPRCSNTLTQRNMNRTYLKIRISFHPLVCISFFRNRNRYRNRFFSTHRTRHLPFEIRLPPSFSSPSDLFFSFDCDTDFDFRRLCKKVKIKARSIFEELIVLGRT